MLMIKSKHNSARLASNILKCYGLMLFTSCSYVVLEEKMTDCTMSNVNFSSEINDANCGLNDGQVSLNAMGGQPPYNYQLNNLVQNEPVFDNLAAGNYTAVVKDHLGCFEQAQIIVQNAAGVSASLEFSASGCEANGGVIEIVPSKGTPPYTYSLNNSVAQSENTFNELFSGNYNVEVIDALACSFDLSIYLPSGVSYQQSVEPIMLSSCATTGCHDGSNSLPDFTQFGEVQANASMIKSRTQSGNMPKDGTLPQSEIDLIACWVDDGALNN